MNMIIEDLIQITSKASIGEYDISNGSVGSNDFGFVFRDINYFNHLIDSSYTSRICNIGTIRKFSKKFQYEKDPNLFLLYDDVSPDLLLIGSVKTLVPTLELGKDDLLFIVGLIVKTPYNKIFPATFYYGPTRLAIGGWNLNFIKSYGKGNNNSFQFHEYFNFNAFDFTPEEQDIFTEAFESALQKVAPSDFEVVYRDDVGDSLMAVKEGVPLYKRIRDNECWPIEILDDGSWSYHDKFEDLIENLLTPADKARIDSGLGLLEYEALRKEVVEKYYNKLVEFARQQDSRIAFQILGYLLMDYGVNIKDETKKLILENSRWRDERHNLRKREDRTKRRNYLLKFRAEILDCNQGKV
ncbi:MAG: hypothetical protein ACFFDF_10410 [Candidatus Odinarchaeota archaeon]